MLDCKLGRNDTSSKYTKYVLKRRKVIKDNILGVLQSEPSKLSAQLQVNVAALHAPLMHGGLQTVKSQKVRMEKSL